MTTAPTPPGGLLEKLIPHDDAKAMRSFPAALLTIGVAIGMVIMVLLFLFFEQVIKAWAGFSPLAFGLLCVYTGIAWFVLRQYRRTLQRLLER